MTAPPTEDRWMGLRITPIMRRRISNFRRNRRAVWSLRIFGLLFLVCLLNSSPMIARLLSGSMANPISRLSLPIPRPTSVAIFRRKQITVMPIWPS